jgi:predicted transposase YbfD/YdcC
MEQRFFLTSLPCDAMRFAQAVREHWGVENALQWVLDVTFGKTIVAFAKAMAHKMVHMARHVTMQEEGSILAPGYCLIHLHEPG